MQYKPYEHQVELAAQGAKILREKMMVYLAMEERTGKTITALLIAEQVDVKTVLVITKKKALAGWSDTLKHLPHSKIYKVTNYHQAHKVQVAPDLVILDESHNYLSTYPKPGKIAKEVRKLVYGCPIIYISATPYAQGPQMLFGQLAMSAWSPWNRFKTFYEWFRVYGIPYTIDINGIAIAQYDRVKSEDVLNLVDDIFISKKRIDLGFKYEPEDKIHDIVLDDNTRAVYNYLVKHDLVELSVGWLVADNASKLRTSLHQLEGGTIKIEDEYHILANQEKADFILQEFGDTESLVIMYHYKAEKLKLEKLFKKATLLQATSYAEGVDLHEFDTLVIYSQDFSTARHTQRRARQCNMKRDTPIVVHHLLVKGAISAQVHKTVNINKKNFVDSTFTRNKL